MWPVSKALADAGFRDSYRDAHPDPVARPGLTWTPGTPPPRIKPTETLDRIDWVMASGPSTTLASRLVGEAGGPDVDVGVDPVGLRPPRGRVDLRRDAGPRAAAGQRLAARGARSARR